VVIGAAGGALRARRLGPSAAALSASALTVGAYWLTHSSIDWFWPYPAVTAPVLALLGSACAPAIVATRTFRRGLGRWAIVVVAAVLALSVVPPYLSERYVNQAFDSWEADRERAFQDLDRASALNPLAEEPLMAEGAIARAAGERSHAIDAFERASQKRPEEWAVHYFLAVLYSKKEPGMARRELELAAEENPLSPRIPVLQDRLGLAAEPSSGRGSRRG
jgi:tetratricopeptide (TPR) repeat protein